MLYTTLFPGRYVQGSQALQSLGEEMKRLGKNALFILDPYVEKNIWPQMENSTLSEISVHLSTFGGECSDKEIDKQVKAGKENKVDIVAGIGGGKTLDAAKAVAHELTVPVAIIPTIASTDAPCSALAVIYSQEGEFDRYLFLPKNPELVLVDSEIIANSPVRFLVSGMGDALATWFEANSCRQSFAPNMSGNHGSNAAYTLAQLCYDTLIEEGLSAKRSVQAHAVTPALDHIIEANTLLSGLGFESGGLAAAHAIHNGLTILQDTHHYYHGEKVAFGTLASLFLTDKPRQIVEQVYSFCETIGLPTTLEDIGLTNVTDYELEKVAERVCAEGETIHNEALPVEPDMVTAALKTADMEGQGRKNRTDY
jgi:glycerol dehydrogenase